jgi:hypothetical protein
MTQQYICSAVKKDAALHTDGDTKKWIYYYKADEDHQFNLLHDSIIVDVVVGERDITKENCPETLLMDFVRINSIRASIQHIAKSLAFMTRVYQSRNTEDADMTEKLTVFFSRESDLCITGEMVCENVRGILGKIDVHASWFDISDKVAVLFMKRIGTYLKSYISAVKHQKPNVAPALAAMIPNIEKEASMLKKISGFHKAIHSDRLREMIESCCRE